MKKTTPVVIAIGNFKLTIAPETAKDILAKLEGFNGVVNENSTIVLIKEGIRTFHIDTSRGHDLRLRIPENQWAVQGNSGNIPQQLSLLLADFKKALTSKK